MLSTVATKSKEKKSHASSSETKPGPQGVSRPTQGAPAGWPLFLERTACNEALLPSWHVTAGNQATQRLLRGGTSQAKLAVSEPGDKYEREADRVAAQIMRTPEPASARITRSGHTCGIGVQRMCSSCEEELGQPNDRQTNVLAKEGPIGPPKNRPATDAHVIDTKGRGTALPSSVRALFEPRFGYDFSNVRVHIDAQAADSAESLSALAYTVGGDIVFGPGQFAPESTQGKRLLAHELTHVIQQQHASRTPGDLQRAQQEAVVSTQLSSVNPRPSIIQRTAGPMIQTQGECDGLPKKDCTSAVKCKDSKDRVSWCYWSGAIDPGCLCKEVNPEKEEGSEATGPAMIGAGIMAILGGLPALTGFGAGWAIGEYGIDPYLNRPKTEEAEELGASFVPGKPYDPSEDKPWYLW